MCCLSEKPSCRSIHLQVLLANWSILPEFGSSRFLILTITIFNKKHGKSEQNVKYDIELNGFIYFGQCICICDFQCVRVIDVFFRNIVHARNTNRNNRSTFFIWTENLFLLARYITWLEKICSILTWEESLTRVSMKGARMNNSELIFNSTANQPNSILKLIGKTFLRMCSDFVISKIL